MTDSTSYQRRDGLNAVVMEGELVMMGPGQGEYFGLRNVSASIWQHLEKPHTVASLTALVAAEYDVDESVCGPDIRSFLDELLAEEAH